MIWALKILSAYSCIIASVLQLLCRCAVKLHFFNDFVYKKINN